MGMLSGDPLTTEDLERIVNAQSVQTLLQVLETKLRATYWEWYLEAKELHIAVKAGKTPEKLGPSEDGINHRIDTLLGGLEHLCKLIAVVRKLALL
jgi:hypothetical protein